MEEKGVGGGMSTHLSVANLFLIKAIYCCRLENYYEETGRGGDLLGYKDSLIGIIIGFKTKWWVLFVITSFYLNPEGRS